jgi:hypothetical protein
MICKGIIVGKYSAAIAITAEVLCRVKRRCADRANGSRFS